MKKKKKKKKKIEEKRILLCYSIRNVISNIKFYNNSLFPKTFLIVQKICLHKLQTKKRGGKNEF